MLTNETEKKMWAVIEVKKVKVQVYSLISSLKTYHSTLHFPLFTGPVQSCVISTQWRAYSPAAFPCIELIVHIAISVLRGTDFQGTESSEAFAGEVPCPKTQH